MQADVVTPPSPVQPDSRRHTAFAVAAVVVAGAVYAAGLAHAALSPFYGNAVSGMAHSWRAFFVGSLDHQGAITIDKQPGFLWPQALSARVFGFHPWALVLPQILEGIVAVAALFVLVRGVFGVRSAALAALAFAVTPIAASTFGHVSEDGLLTMAVIVAAAFWHRAWRTGRSRDLIWCGLFVALGFQAKMIAAWFVLVPFVVAWLICAPPPGLKKWRQIGLLVAVSVIGSLSWAIVIAVLRLGGRPFVDGTTNGDPFTMIFGYNGLARLGTFPGSLPVSPAPVMSALDRSPIKLFAPDLYSQYGWFLPLAVAAAIALVIGSSRRDQARAATVMWIIWLAVPMLVFSATTLPHTSYVLALAPPIAALFGAGLPALVTAFRARSSWWWLLPVAVVLSALAALGVQATFASFAAGAGFAAGGLALVAGAALVTRLSGRHVRAAVALGVAGVTLAATIWTGSVVDARYAGTASDPAAGPGGLGQHTQPATTSASVLAAVNKKRRAFLSYVAANSAPSSHGRFVLVSNSWQILSPYIAADPSAGVLALGGYSGAAPAVTLATFRTWVAQGRISFVLVDPTPLGQPALRSAEATRIAHHVEQTCTRVHPTSASGTALIDSARLLYRCSAPAN